MFLFGPPNIQKMKAKRDIKGLIKVLIEYKKSQPVRWAAATALGELHDVQAITPLITVLETEKSSYLRSYAAMALAKLGNEIAISPLIDTLKSWGMKFTDSPEVVDLLVSFGDRSINPLFLRMKTSFQIIGEKQQILDHLKNLKPLVDRLNGASTDETDRILTSVASKLPNELAIKEVFYAIGAYQEASVDFQNELDFMRSCLTILRRINGMQGGKILVLFAENKDIQIVREAAIKELNQCANTFPMDLLIEMMKSEEKLVRREAIQVLREKREIIPETIFLKALSDNDNLVKLAAIEVVSSTKEAFKPLVNILTKSKDLEPRMAALEKLKEIDEMRSQLVEPLIACLTDPNESIRREAALWLGHNQEKQAVIPLTFALTKKPMKEIADALGKLKDERAVESLVKAYDNPDEEIRSSIVSALGEIANDDAICLLIKALDDQDGDVVNATVDSLVKIGQSTIQPLVESLSIEKLGAGLALDRLGWQPDKGVKGAIYWIQKKNWAECVNIGKSAVPILIEQLQKADNQISAIETLQKIGDTRAIEPLLDCMKDSRKSVRRATSNALVQMYNGNKLGAVEKQAIFAQKDRMLEPHEDTHGHTDWGGRQYSDCPSDTHDDYATHEDKGIGINF